MEGLDLSEDKKVIISVDYLTDVKPYPMKKELSKTEILAKLDKQDEFINLVLELGPNAIAQYKKYHPFQVSISYTDPYQSTAILKTFINVNKHDELSEMINWLLFLGEDLKIMKAPEEALTRMQQRVYRYMHKEQ